MIGTYEQSQRFNSNNMHIHKMLYGLCEAVSCNHSISPQNTLGELARNMTGHLNKDTKDIMLPKEK